MNVESYKSIKEISKELWNSFVNENKTFLRYEYLKNVEETSPIDYKFWYLLIKENNTIIASACLFSMPLSLDLLCTGVIRSISIKVRKLFKKFLIIHPLIVGSPPSLGNNTVILSPDADKDKVLALIKINVEEIAVKNQLGLIAYKEFESKDCSFMDKLSNEYNYIKVNSLPTNKLELKWNNFEDYLKALRTPYRQSINANIRRLNKGTAKTEIITNINEIFNNYHFDLYKSVLDKAEFKLEELTIDYFKRMSGIPNSQACLVSINKEGLMLGYFLVCNSEKDTLAAMFAGINYQYNRQFDIYFNLFYEVIKLAIDRNKTIIEFGQNSYQFKSRIGCRQYPLYIYLKHKNRFYNFFIKKFSDILFPKYEIKEKNAFKPERS